jgi:predicted deacetylase
VLTNYDNTLCVSIHDVAPATWPHCLRLLQALRAVADIPISLLVVPAYHGQVQRVDTYEKMLERLLGQGHELVLHGYCHRDSGPAPRHWRERVVRRVLTEGEGEFAAIDAAEARQLLRQGLAWFAQRRWPVHGFVAPAWLMGPGAWQAVQEFPFAYTTTRRHFHLLQATASGTGHAAHAASALHPPQLTRRAPSLVFASRNMVGRWLSRPWTSLLARVAQPAPLVRLCLHPRDAASPLLLRQAQRLLDTMLLTHQPLTKHAYALRWRQQLAEADGNGRRKW